MDYTEPVPAPPLKPPEITGEWYLRGFADAYHAHVAVIPAGPAGDQYSKGYMEGLAAFQRDVFAEIWS
jgi:hypothetical protein